MASNIVKLCKSGRLWGPERVSFSSIAPKSYFLCGARESCPLVGQDSWRDL